MNPNDDPEETPTPRKVKKMMPKTPTTNRAKTVYTTVTADQVTGERDPE